MALMIRMSRQNTIIQDREWLDEKCEFEEKAFEEESGCRDKEKDSCGASIGLNY